MPPTRLTLHRIQLDLGLESDWNERLRTDRHDSLEELEPGCPDDREVMHGVRLGPAFFSSPKTLDDVPKYLENRRQFSDCLEQMDLIVELGVQNLTKHILCQMLDEEGSDYEDSDNDLGLPSNRQELIEHSVQENISAQFQSFYVMGKNDGFEDGAAVLKAILGDNPRAAAWYPFSTLPPDTTRPTARQHLSIAATGLVHLPLRIESSVMAENRFTTMLGFAGAYMRGLEQAIATAVTYSRRQFIIGRPGVLRDVFYNSNVSAELRKQTRLCAEYVYNVGHRLGYQLGQGSVKKTYGSQHRDDKLYNLTTRGEGCWIVVSKLNPVACTCDCCPWCIDAKNSGSWDRQTRNVRSDLERIARQLSRR